MVSKTVLATHPRHRPGKEAIDAGWREACPGQWTLDEVVVSLEIDGLWHSYAQITDTRRHSPGFPALAEAMRDAESRARIPQLKSA